MADVIGEAKLVPTYLVGGQVDVEGKLKGKGKLLAHTFVVIDSNAPTTTMPTNDGKYKLQNK